MKIKQLLFGLLVSGIAFSQTYAGKRKRDYINDEYKPPNKKRKIDGSVTRLELGSEENADKIDFAIYNNLEELILKNSNISNKQLNKIISKNTIKRLTVDGCDNITFKGKIIWQQFTSLEELTLCKYKEAGKIKLTSFFTKLSPSLKKLTFIDCCKTCFWKRHNLEVLNVINCEGEYSFEMLRALPNKITKINFSGTKLEMPIKNTPYKFLENLEVFTLDIDYDKLVILMKIIINKNPKKLKELNLNVAQEEVDKVKEYVKSRFNKKNIQVCVNGKPVNRVQEYKEDELFGLEDNEDLLQQVGLKHSDFYDDNNLEKLSFDNDDSAWDCCDSNLEDNEDLLQEVGLNPSDFYYDDNLENCDYDNGAIPLDYFDSNLEDNEDQTAFSCEQGETNALKSLLEDASFLQDLNNDVFFYQFDDHVLQ